MADIYTFRLDRVYTFDWKYGLFLTGNGLTFLTKWLLLLATFICVDVWSWYVFVTLQTLTSEENFVPDKISRSQPVQ